MSLENVKPSISTPPSKKMEQPKHTQPSCAQISQEVSWPFVDIKREPPWNDEEDLLEELYSMDPAHPNKIMKNKSTQTTPLHARKESESHELEPATSAYCALCLRRYQRELFLEFTKGADGPRLDAEESERKLKKAVDLDLSLTNRVICRACWSLVETITDFGECCLRARMRAEQFTDEISDDCKKDDWLSNEIIESIDRIHEAIQVHTGRIDKEDFTKETPDNDISVDETEVQTQLHLIDPVDTENSNSSQEISYQVEQLSSEESDSVDAKSVSVSEKVDIRTCGKCLKQFETKSGYSIHSFYCKTPAKRNVKEKLFDCSLCSASFETQRLLEYHSNRHKGIKPFKCRRGCKSSFYSPRVRSSHEKYCDNSGQMCEICGAVLHNKHNVLAHIDTVHRDQEGKRQYACDTCGLSFKVKRSLIRHMLVHSGIRNYPCSVCGKAFKSSYAANVHMRIHTQEKPFVCTICGDAFAYKCLLKNHVNRVHENSE